jgi:hypothetical protein
MIKTIKLTFILSLLTLFPCTTSASDTGKIGDIQFGDNYNIALKAIQKDFGVPSKADNSEIEYENKSYLGVNFDKVIFSFKNSKLVEARFISYKNSKYAANKSIKIFANKIKSDYDLSMDIEDNGSFFYKGGVAKTLDGRLFTLFIRKDLGRWSVQMRYGPFKI